MLSLQNRSQVQKKFVQIADLIVEAAFEDMEVKKQTFKELTGDRKDRLYLCYKYIFTFYHRNRCRN